ncbi:MAG TPA: pyridoxal phosphate-dependent aminotransferase [Gemmatimonadaceae bacterium]|nr:pyridoxal phosphate-dependent aminotransferase [Gemmatimonadaceae bacterium]
MPLYAKRLDDLGVEGSFTFGAEIARAIAAGRDVVRLTIGEPDFDSAPHVNEAGIAEIRRGNTHYSDPQGILPLRQAIATYVARTRGIPVEPDRVIVLSGAKPSISLTIQTYVDPGDEVICPAPGFAIYEGWTTFMGGVPVPLRLREERDFAFTAEDLAAVITPKTKLIMLCSPSNPTGGVLPASLLAEVAAVIRERCRPDVRVYSDEIYEHIVFDGAVHASIASQPGMAERTVIASGASKGFAMTGWRLGWAVLPTADEAQTFKRQVIQTTSCVAPFTQEAGRVALESPASYDQIARMVESFRARRDWVVPALNAIPGVTCRSPQGAFYVFPNIAGVCRTLGVLEAYDALPADARRQTSPSRLFQLFALYRHGVAVLHRESFGVRGAEGQHYVRLSIATSMDQLREGVARIAAAAADRAGFAQFMTEPESRR